jgi:hypothetical protein
MVHSEERPAPDLSSMSLRQGLLLVEHLHHQVGTASHPEYWVSALLWQEAAQVLEALVSQKDVLGLFVAERLREAQVFDG